MGSEQRYAAAMAKIEERISAASVAHGMSYNWKVELQDAYKALKAELSEAWTAHASALIDRDHGVHTPNYGEAAISRIAAALGVE